MSKQNNVNSILPAQILNLILKSGLVIVGGKGTGKSSAGKFIASQIIRTQPLPIQVKIFDQSSTFKWDFEPILYQTIDESTRYFYDGETEHILFDLNLIDEMDTLSFMSKVVYTDYLKQRARKEELGGHVDKWILYLTEEAHGITGSYSLIRKEGTRLMTLYAMGRNFGQTYILIGQRLADLSSRAVERVNTYLFSRMVGDNDLAKLKRIVGRKSVILDEVQKLEIEKGQFLYYDGRTTMDFNCPKYESNGQRPRPYILDLKTIPTWRHREGVKIL